MIVHHLWVCLMHHVLRHRPRHPPGEERYLREPWSLPRLHDHPWTQVLPDVVVLWDQSRGPPDEANGGVGDVATKKGKCLTAVGKPCLAHFV
jgi:hypothetical protein